MKETKTKVVEKIANISWRKVCVFYKAVIFILLAGYMRICFCFCICRNAKLKCQKFVWDWSFFAKKSCIFNLEFCDRIWSLFRMNFFISLWKLSAHIYAAKKVNKYKIRIINSKPNFIYFSTTTILITVCVFVCVYKCTNHTENVRHNQFTNR